MNLNLQKNTLLVPFAIFVFTLTYYIFLLPPGITFEDAGYFLAASLNGGYAHPPGYPLYTLLLKIWVSVGSLFSDNQAFLGSLFSSVLSALSVSLFYVLLLQTKIINTGAPVQNMILAVLISLLAATSFEFIEQSLLIEVYSLHIFLLVALFLSLKWQKYLWTGLITGLALSNHSTAIYFFAFTFLWLILIDQKKWKEILLPGCKLFLPGVALGLLPYLYLPFVANPESPLQWGAADTYLGFKEIVFRTNYWKLPASSLATQWEQLKIAGDAFLLQWGYLIPLLFISSFFLYFVKPVNKRNVVFWHLCWFIQIPIMAILANMGSTDESIKLVSVFFIPAYFFTVVIIGKALSEALPLITEQKQKIAFALVAALLSMQLLYSGFQNGQKANMSSYNTPKLSTDQLKSTLNENKALLFTWNDFSFTPVVYEKFVKKDFDQLTPIPYSFFKDLSMIEKYRKMHKLNLKPLKKAVVKFYQQRVPGQIGVIPDKEFYAAFAENIKIWLDKGYDVFVEYKITEPGFRSLYFDPKGSFFQILLNKPLKETSFSFINEPPSKKGAGHDIWHREFYGKYAQQSILKALLHQASPNKEKYLQHALLFSKGTSSEKKIREGIKKHFPNYKLN